MDTLPETNIAHENPIFPGKYHQNGGFSMAMLVSGSVTATMTPYLKGGYINLKKPFIFAIYVRFRGGYINDGDMHYYPQLVMAGFMNQSSVSLDGTRHRMGFIPKLGAPSEGSKGQGSDSHNRINEEL